MATFLKGFMTFVEHIMGSDYPDKFGLKKRFGDIMVLYFVFCQVV